MHRLFLNSWHNTLRSIHLEKTELEAIWSDHKKREFPCVDKLEVRLKYAVDRDWLDGLGYLTQIIAKKSTIPCYAHGRVLYAFLRHYLATAKIIPGSQVNIVETGTARGFSALCFAKALEDTGRSGKIVTIDVLPNRVAMFWNCITDFEGEVTRIDLLKNYDRLVQEFLFFLTGDTQMSLQSFDVQRVNVAYLDATHDYFDVAAELQWLSKRQRSSDLIIADDFDQELFPGVIKAVTEFSNALPYSLEIVHIENSRKMAVLRRS